MKKRVYLDHAAATPLHKEVYKAMKPYFSLVGNPGASHHEGRVLKEVLEDARNEVAKTLKVRSEEVIFTGGATEGNTLAILGYVEALRTKGYTYKDMHIVTSQIEHANVRKCVEYLKDKGVLVSVVAPNEEGLISPSAVEKSITEKTVLVSIQYINSEIGVIQPLRKIKTAIRKVSSNIVLHTDAAQAGLYVPLLQEKLGADLIVLDAQKFGGPKGVGALIKKHHVGVAPVVFGGSQEWGIRPGTENVPLIVGFAKALSRAQEGCDARAHSVATLRNWFIHEIERALPNAVLNGSREERVAHNINISFPDLDTEYLATLLDQDGFAVSTKTTCAGVDGNGSDVVRAISHDEKRARSTLRISLGEDTTKKNLEDFLKALTGRVQFLDESKI